MNKILLGLGVLCFSSAWAIVPVDDTSSTIFSSLQVEKSQSNMKLDVAKLKLQRLQVQEEIDKLTGASKANPNNINIKVKNISIFNDNKLAVITIDGVMKTYKVGDVLTENLMLKDISNKSVKVLNTDTQKTMTYLIS